MDLIQLQRFFLWGAVINYGILMVWFLAIWFAKGWIHGLHGRWFKLTPEQFDAIHYTGISIYKILVLVLFLVPWIVLRFIL